jgi:nicotinamide-nucleotide amidase
MIDMTLITLSQKVGKRLAEHGLILVTAESCTGGGIAQVITEIAGSSAWFDRSFVTYSNQAKQEMLDVKIESLEMFGAVSEQIAQEMAFGALQCSHADIAVSVTGIAGPSGGSPDKPVGTVCFGLAGVDNFIQVDRQVFSGDRSQVRNQSIYHALQLIDKYVENNF